MAPRLQHRLSLERWPHQRPPLQIGLKAGVIGIKTKNQHMHQTALEQTADFHPSPEAGHGTALASRRLKHLHGRPVGGQAVVIGDG